jgi:myo-inositol-1(or 4)-monophosphatase
VGNFTGEADFLDQKECLAGTPKIYGQLVPILSKYSKFASAGEKAGLRQAGQLLGGSPAATENSSTAENPNTHQI